MSEELATMLPTSIEQLVAQKSAVLPMRCLAAKCIYALNCPLQQAGTAPKGESCPIEKLLIGYMTEQYVASLGIDPQNYVEMSMLADIIEMEIYDLRVSGELSISALLIDQAVGVGSDGEPILRKEASPALDAKLQIKKHKDTLRRAFLATREIKAKYKMREVKDFSQMLSDLRRLSAEQAAALPEERKILDLPAPVTPPSLNDQMVDL